MKLSKIYNLKTCFSEAHITDERCHPLNKHPAETPGYFKALTASFPRAHTPMQSARVSNKPYLFLFSSSAISCLCCLFASMVKEMSGALRGWVGCCKANTWLTLLNIGNGNRVCSTRQGAWDRQTWKKKLFLSKHEKQIHDIAIHLLRTNFFMNLEDTRTGFFGKE